MMGLPSRSELDEASRQLRDVAELGERAHEFCKKWDLCKTGSPGTKNLANAIASTMTPETVQQLRELARALLTWPLR